MDRNVKETPPCLHRCFVPFFEPDLASLEGIFVPAVRIARSARGRVVYTTAADNSRSTRIRYNALISPLSVGGGRTSLPTGKRHATIGRFPEDTGTWLQEAEHRFSI
jgi:hypothetical protein